MKTLQIKNGEPGNLTTQAFYQHHSQEYYKSTVDLDMHDVYEPFLKEMAPRAHILDAGCGSGRDTKAFLEKGYRVTAIDRSVEMADLATHFTGQRCEVVSFQELEFKEKFDGIWACASLLHVPKREMHDVINRLIIALKTGGILYLSLKEGEGERVAEDGRFFNYYTMDSFREVLAYFPALRELAFWKSEEIRSSQNRILWLNFLLKKRRS
ncbi:class I SAM-dependent methyltransferase [bacterium]|nr:class I SAM-dependent methyltransferase [bacterium]